MKQNDFLLIFLTVAGIGAFGFTLYVLAYKTIPDSNREIFVHAIGIVEGVVLTIYGFRFGSSIGSKEKTKALIDNQTTTTTTP